MSICLVYRKQGSILIKLFSMPSLQLLLMDRGYTYYPRVYFIYQSALGRYVVVGKSHLHTHRGTDTLSHYSIQMCCIPLATSGKNCSLLCDLFFTCIHTHIITYALIHAHIHVHIIGCMAVMYASVHHTFIGLTGQKGNRSAPMWAVTMVIWQLVVYTCCHSF